MVLSVKDLKRVSNTAQIPLKKPDEVAEARRMEGKSKSSLQLLENQEENKIKKSKLAYWLNYKKDTILYLPISA